MIDFIALVLNTFFLWSLVLYLHLKRNSLTLIPFYSFIAIVTVFNHILSSFNLNLLFNGYFFFVSSTAYFTTLLLSILLLYLYDGVHAARKALEIVLFASFFLVFVIVISAIEDPKNIFIPSVFATYQNYFWSITALFVDIVLMAIGWELVNKVKRIPIVISLSLLLFTIYMVDAFIYVTGVFWGQSIYWEIIKTDLIVRGILSIVMGIFLSRYLSFINFSEKKREKPKSIFGILDFRSSDERKVIELSSQISQKEKTEKELIRIKELYNDVLSAIEVGIWEWTVKTGKIVWSDRAYELLGYSKEDIKDLNYEYFMSLVHPADKSFVEDRIKEHFQKEDPYYHAEYRLKTRGGGYKWFSANGLVDVDNDNKPIRMVGSLIDINEKKVFEQQLKEKVDALSKMNEYFVGRELRIKELKDEVEKLKKAASD